MTASTLPDLECDSLTKHFGASVAVDDVSFAVPAGSFFSILGPSGCGKTTIMRMIAGFLEPTSGDIRIKGRSVLDVPPNKRPVNMVFQHLALFPMMNIADNIGYGLRRKGMAKGEFVRKVDEALDRIGLPGIGTRRVDELSGGQKQRVAIARALAMRPPVMLFDEVTSALDPEVIGEVTNVIRRLVAEHNLTMLMVTHQMGFARDISDRICFFYQGKIEEIAYLGSHSVMHIFLDSGLKLLAHVPNSRRWASEDFTWEDRVWTSWDDMAGVVLSS
jgi:spermidine/putrescine transport system ATP-binding protein